MRIGCPKEIKTREYRVGLTPTAAREAVAHGHGVLVERGAGEGSGYADADYLAVGAEIVAEAAEVWARSELVVKVKEPQAAERAMLRAGQVLFAYLHLAPDPEQTRDLLASGATAIAYETVTDARRRAAAAGADVGGGGAAGAAGRGLDAADGERRAGGAARRRAGGGAGEVAVIGGGVVGTQAARVAAGMGAEVTVLDLSLPRLRTLDEMFGGGCGPRFASTGGDRGGGGGGRPGDRRGADPRGGGAEAGEPGAARG